MSCEWSAELAEELRRFIDVTVGDYQALAALAGVRELTVKNWAGVGQDVPRKLASKSSAGLRSALVRLGLGLRTDAFGNLSRTFGVQDQEGAVLSPKQLGEFVYTLRELEGEVVDQVARRCPGQQRASAADGDGPRIAISGGRLHRSLPDLRVLNSEHYLPDLLATAIAANPDPRLIHLQNSLSGPKTIQPAQYDVAPTGGANGVTVNTFKNPEGLVLSLEVSLPGHFQHFDRSLLVKALEAVLGTKVDDVAIVSLKPGSVVVTLQGGVDALVGAIQVYYFFPQSFAELSPRRAQWVWLPQLWNPWWRRFTAPSSFSGQPHEVLQQRLERLTSPRIDPSDLLESLADSIGAGSAVLLNVTEGYSAVASFGPPFDWYLNTRIDWNGPSGLGGLPRSDFRQSYRRDGELVLRTSQSDGTRLAWILQRPTSLDLSGNSYDDLASDLRLQEQLRREFDLRVLGEDGPPVLDSYIIEDIAQWALSVPWEQQAMVLMHMDGRPPHEIGRWFGRGAHWVERSLDDALIPMRRRLIREEVTILGVPRLW